MEASIRKIKNQPLYEVKFYVKTRKEAKQAIAMHSMTGGILSLRQAYDQNIAMGLTPAQARDSYLNSLQNMHGQFEDALRQLRQDFQGEPAVAYEMAETLHGYYTQQGRI